MPRWTATLVVVLALQVGAASADTGDCATLALPDTEDPRAWAPVAAAAGLALAAPRTSCGAWLTVTGGAWALTVRLSPGDERTTPVPPPADDGARQDIVVLAASLLATASPADPAAVRTDTGEVTRAPPEVEEAIVDASPVEDGPTATEDPPPGASEDDSTAAEPPEEPEADEPPPEAAADPEDAAPSAPAETAVTAASPSAPEAAPGRSRAWVSGAGVVAARPALRATGGGAVTVGGCSRWFCAGGVVDLLGPWLLGNETTVRATVGLGGVVAWAPRWAPVSAYADLRLLFAVRRWEHGGEHLSTFALPLLAISLGPSFRPTPGLHLRPVVGLRLDLRPTLVFDDHEDDEGSTLSPVGLTAGLVVAFDGRRP